MAPSHQTIDPVYGEDIQQNDILLGRGVQCACHVGSIALKAMVASKLKSYILATSQQCKTLLTLEVVNSVQQEGGRFLTKRVIRKMTSTYGLAASDTISWHTVPDNEARLKIREMFRDCIKSTQREGLPSVLLQKLGLTDMFSKVTPFAAIVKHVANSSSIRNFRSARKHSSVETRIAKETSGDCSSTVTPLPVSMSSPTHHGSDDALFVPPSIQADQDSAPQQRTISSFDTTSSSVCPDPIPRHSPLLPLQTSVSCSRLENNESSQMSCCNNKTALTMATPLNHEFERSLDLNENAFDAFTSLSNKESSQMISCNHNTALTILAPLNHEFERSFDLNENNFDAFTPLSIFHFANHHEYKNDDDTVSSNCDDTMEEAIRHLCESTGDDVWNDYYLLDGIQV